MELHTKGLFETLNINDIQHKLTNMKYVMLGCRYAERRLLFVVMLFVVMLNVVMLSVLGQISFLSSFGGAATFNKTTL